MIDVQSWVPLEAHSILFFNKTKDCFTEIKKLF